MLQMSFKGAVCATLVLLAACGSGGGAAPASQGPSMIVKGSNPTQLFSHISKQIRTCWLNPRDPVLTRHDLRSEAAAGGNTQIVISDQQQGQKAFSIDFKSLSDGTQIVANNHSLQYGLAQKLNSDLGYWLQGGLNCDGPGEASGSELRGSVSGPIAPRAPRSSR